MRYQEHVAQNFGGLLVLHHSLKTSICSSGSIDKISHCACHAKFLVGL